jgi:hypothetical protein
MVVVSEPACWPKHPVEVIGRRRVRNKETAMTPNDQDTKALQVHLSIDEHEERTRAKARLHWRGKELVGVGLARLNPADEPVTEIGDELAVARALSDLVDQLIRLTESDIEAHTHEPVTPLHP